MKDETAIVPEPVSESAPDTDSQVLNVSIRAWIALLLVFTVCIMAAFGRDVEEPLYSLALLAVGFYFGQRNAVNK